MFAKIMSFVFGNSSKSKPATKGAEIHAKASTDEDDDYREQERRRDQSMGTGDFLDPINEPSLDY